MKKNIPALLTHIRLLINTETNNTINYDNLCIEYKFLKEGGEINENKKNKTL